MSMRAAHPRAIRGCGRSPRRGPGPPWNGSSARGSSTPSAGCAPPPRRSGSAGPRASRGAPRRTAGLLPAGRWTASTAERAAPASSTTRAASAVTALAPRCWSPTSSSRSTCSRSGPAGSVPRSRRDGSPSGPWSSCRSTGPHRPARDLLATDAATRTSSTAPNLATAVHALLAEPRQGLFPVRPRECGFCPLGSVCRISERRAPQGAEG